jgi:hypothetical protein
VRARDGREHEVAEKGSHDHPVLGQTPLHFGESGLNIALLGARGGCKKLAQGPEEGDILVPTHGSRTRRHTDDRVRVPTEKLDERQMAEAGGDVEWFAPLLRVGKRALGMGSRLIRAAVEPQCDGALREGCQHGVDSVRIGMELDRLPLDALEHLCEQPDRDPEVSVPQLGPAAREFSARWNWTVFNCSAMWASSSALRRAPVSSVPASCGYQMAWTISNS